MLIRIRKTQMDKSELWSVSQNMGYTNIRRNSEAASAKIWISDIWIASKEERVTKNETSASRHGKYSI